MSFSFCARVCLYVFARSTIIIIKKILRGECVVLLFFNTRETREKEREKILLKKVCVPRVCCE